MFLFSKSSDVIIWTLACSPWDYAPINLCSTIDIKSGPVGFHQILVLVVIPLTCACLLHGNICAVAYAFYDLACFVRTLHPAVKRLILPVLNILAPRAYGGISYLDVVVQICEWNPYGKRVKPERYPGKLYCEWIDIDSKDAALHYAPLEQDVVRE